MTTTLIDYEAVQAIYRKVYGELREATGENAPSSYTWFEPTREALEEECPTGVGPIRTNAMGGPDRPVIAWAYQCEARELTAIHDDAMGADIEVYFRYCVGLEG